MALAFVGDTHGFMRQFRDVVMEIYRVPSIKACIQVGDFGINIADIRYFHENHLPIPTYFIDGNHEYFDIFYGGSEIREIAPNLFYVPRGTVKRMDGRVVAFLGGARSINKKQLIEGGDLVDCKWDLREDIRDFEVERLFKNLEEMGNPKVDILVTHIPPNSIIEKYFDSMYKLTFDVPVTWTDPNGLIVEDVWNKLGKPAMFCGHMHKDVQFGENAYILDKFQLRCL